MYVTFHFENATFVQEYYRATSSIIFLICYTLITKKFGRKNNSDKRVSENLTVWNFRRPKSFTSEIFPELFQRENENEG